MARWLPRVGRLEGQRMFLLDRCLSKSDKNYLGTMFFWQRVLEVYPFSPSRSGHHPEWTIAPDVAP